MSKRKIAGQLLKHSQKEETQNKDEISFSSLLELSKKLAMTFILTLALLFALLVAVQLIPTEKIIWKVHGSDKILSDEGDYPNFLFYSANSVLDNWTDSLMIDTAINADASHPIKSALEARHHEDEDYNTQVKALVESVEARMNNETSNLNPVSYTRYWHGYLVYLRPLLRLFNMSQIRYINLFTFSILFFLVLATINRILGRKYSLGLLLSMIFSMVYLVPMSMQYSATFYISFLLILHLLKSKEKGFDYFACSFMVAGMLTSYIDLLTTPIITLGLPLTIYILLKRENYTSIRKSIVNLSVLMASWLFGYAANWCSKWILAAAILRDNSIEIAVSSIVYRTSNRDYSRVTTNWWLESIQKNISYFFNGSSSEVVFLFIITLILMLFSAFFFCSKKEHLGIMALNMLIVSALPLIWYFCLANHSVMHAFFTFRALGVSVFTLFAFLLTCTDETQISKYKNRILMNLQK